MDPASRLFLRTTSTPFVLNTRDRVHFARRGHGAAAPSPRPAAAHARASGVPGGSARARRPRGAPGARAQLAAEDLYAPDAPADADGTADGLKGDANETEADYGGTGDGADADSVEAPPSYEEMVQELLNPTDASAQQSRSPRRWTSTPWVWRPSSPFAARRAAAVREHGQDFSDLEQDVLELEKRLAPPEAWAETARTPEVSDRTRRTRPPGPPNAAADAADDAADSAAVTSDDLMTNPRVFVRQGHTGRVCGPALGVQARVRGPRAGRELGVVL